MKKIFLGLLAPLFLIGVASCGNNNNINEIDDNDNQITLSNNVNTVSNNDNIYQTKNLEYEPIYEDVNISYETSNLQSSTSVVEETVEDVYDSVVSITATSTSSISSGSAVFFAEDNNLGFSYLITCFHVIEDACSFYITTSNENTYDAYLVAGYEDEDLAIMAIETPNDEEITYASLFEDSNNLKLGSGVICIGNPLGILPGSVSVGVVSYNNRVVSVDTYKKQTLIQTDVAINSGNSGGGLFNYSGALIGIVSAKYSSSGIEGLGFAIPSNTVLDVIEKLMSTAKYDIANKCFSEGYYDGDYEFGFTISLGTYRTNNSKQTVLYISSINSEDGYTGDGLEVNDIISSVSIDYSVTTKKDTTLDSFSSVDDIMLYLYNSDLEVGDRITFVVYRSNTRMNITFDVEQFIYSI